MGPISKPIVERAKEPSSWLGAATLIGAAAGAIFGKPTLGDPVFWGSLLNVVAGIGLILTPHAKKKTGE